MPALLDKITHSTIHYLLSIHKLKEDHGYARVTDVAQHLGYTRGSTSLALKALKEKKLVIEDSNRFLSLSEEAHEIVHQTLTTRTLFYYFLKNHLGVSKKNSELDSCLVEHLFSEETQEKLFLFMKNGLKNKKTDLLFLPKTQSFSEFKAQQKGDKYYE